MFHGDELVAEVVLADGRKHITLLADDMTMVSEPLGYDARTELDRYSAHLAVAVGVLEASQAQVTLRDGSGCSYYDFFDSPSEMYCIVSTCGGGCSALDCVPFTDVGGEEIHDITPGCF